MFGIVVIASRKVVSISKIVVFMLGKVVYIIVDILFKNVEFALKIVD